MARPSSRAVSSHSAITVSAFARASWRVEPSAAQPGNSGTSATNAWAAAVAADRVEPDIGFRERPDVGQPGQAEPADAVHPEGDQAHVAGAAELIGPDPGREQGGHGVRSDGPVQEGEREPRRV